MPISQFCNEKTVRVGPSATAHAIAKKMKAQYVNDVVVEEKVDGKVRVFGVITDRDIALGCVADNIELSDITARDLIDRDPVTVAEDCGVFEAIEKMKKEGVRRLLVLDKKGEVSRVLTADSLLQCLGQELNLLGDLFKDQPTREKNRNKFRSVAKSKAV